MALSTTFLTLPPAALKKEEAKPSHLAQLLHRIPSYQDVHIDHFLVDEPFSLNVQLPPEVDFHHPQSLLTLFIHPKSNPLLSSNTNSYATGDSRRIWHDTIPAENATFLTVQFCVDVHIFPLDANYYSHMKSRSMYLDILWD